MKKYFSILLVTLIVTISNNTQLKCPVCNHICDNDCVYIDGICQHECNSSTDPLAKWDPWD